MPPKKSDANGDKAKGEDAEKSVEEKLQDAMRDAKIKFIKVSESLAHFVFL